jgi:hypothetical protein
MKPRNLALRITAIALVTALPYALSLVGCGNSNPTPPGPDASHPPDGSGHDSKADTSKQQDSKATDTNVPDNVIVDSGTDANLPDVNLDSGSCKSDSSACNSCYTDAQAAADPFNACSAYTKNCVPFTTTVPTVPPL